MFWFWTQREDCSSSSKAKDSDAEQNDDDDDDPDAEETERTTSDDTCAAVANATAALNKELDELERVQQELTDIREQARITRHSHTEQVAKLQANLQAKRFQLAKATPRAKQHISYFEYCRIIRETFDAPVEESKTEEEEASPSSPSYSWYGWCEGFLLRGLHQAMMTKEQLDIAQRNCNALLMEVYAERLGQEKRHKTTLPKKFMAVIIQTERYLAQRQQLQRHYLDIQSQMIQRLLLKVGPSTVSVTTTSSSTPPISPLPKSSSSSLTTPTKSILKNSTGKSINRWTESKATDKSISPTPRRTASLYEDQDKDDNSSQDDEDDDDDDVFQDAQMENDDHPHDDGETLLTSTSIVLQPPPVYAVP